MIDFDVYLDKYQWTIRICFITVKESLFEIMQELEDEGFSNKVITTLYTTIIHRKNTGFICSDFKRHLSYMIINNATTIAEFLDTFNHEKNHIKMHICKALDIDPFSEEASVLSGNLAKSIYLAVIKCNR